MKTGRSITRFFLYGGVNNTMTDKIKIFFYDPYTNLYTGNELVSAEEEKMLSQNFTETPVIAEKTEKLIIYNTKNDSWYYISEYCYRIDEKGFLLEKYKNPLPIDALSDDLIDEPLTENFTNPRWNGNSWEDKPVPNNLYSPVFDLNRSEWIEGATTEFIRNCIDAETNRLIAKWCVDQTKCEEYYINKGIESNTDPEYLAYKEAKKRIIEAQRQKKIEAGVYE
jgi:hypothetical protein